jgi:tetratricopeptide (TPR) repeat protein
VLFLNRTKEINDLLACLPPLRRESSIVLLVSPEGLGKSALMEQVAEHIRARSVATVVTLDPNIYGVGVGTLPWPGYFVQRIAGILSNMLEPAGSEGFGAFLDSAKQRVRRVMDKDFLEVVRSGGGTGSLIGHAVDLTERALAVGSFDPTRLLDSGDSRAVTYAEDYLEYTCGNHPLCFIVRDAQHIDQRSLMFLLKLKLLPVKPVNVVFEFTTNADWQIESGRWKVIDRCIGRDDADVFRVELRKLGLECYEMLMRPNDASTDLVLDAGQYDRWKGDIRNAEDFRRGRFERGEIATPGLFSLPIWSATPTLLEERLSALNRHLQMCLALLAAHIEPIPQEVLLSLLLGMNQYTRPKAVSEIVESLESEYGLIKRSYGNISVRSDDVAVAVGSLPDFEAVLRLARERLKEYYLDEVLRPKDSILPSDAISIRQAFLLSSQTNDVNAVLSLIYKLDDRIRRSTDQSFYIGAALRLLLDSPDLFPPESAELRNWASRLAYERSDFASVIRLLESTSEDDIAQTCVLASSQLEEGLHDSAKTSVGRVRDAASSPEHDLAADLIELMIERDLGAVGRAQAIQNEIFRKAPETSAMLGYALRFSESLKSQPLDDVLRSVEMFRNLGLYKSQAYSQVTAAIHLARMGAADHARAVFDEACSLLSTDIRDEHLILNNLVAIDLLGGNPNVEHSRLALARALRMSRDDFSDLAILNNSALVEQIAGNLDAAVRATEEMLRLLEAPAFSDTNVAWAVCFNAALVFRAAGLGDRSTAVLGLPRIPPAVYQKYWDIRYGFSDCGSDEFSHMLSLPYHPISLSHWLIDLEGLDTLKAAPPR